MIKVKRVYDPPARADGCRVLVDRVWPRGLKKADAAIERWMKEIAPSAELRKWFGHDPARWRAFTRRYARELRRRPDEVAWLEARARDGTLTLLFSARETRYNNAVALKDYLESE